MGAEVEGQKYNGVDVTHPTIREYATNMIKAGHNDAAVSRVIGVPTEVVASIRREVQNRK